MNDAFGRLRTSEPYTLFEYYPNAGSTNNDLDADTYLTNAINGGTINYNTNDNTFDLTAIPNGTVSIATRQTKLPMEYQPGKSRLIYMSAIPINTTSTEVTVRIGVFSVDYGDPITHQSPIEGHYFELSNNILKWVYRYNNADVESIVKTNWNIDTFDGNGPSGITLDSDSMTKNVLFVIDQEWLGVGRTRVGFNIGGVNYYAHEFVPDYTYPYTTSPRLPLTYQISALSITTSFTLKQICSTCISEGGFTPLGKKISITTGIDPITVNTANSITKYIIMGLKLKSTITKTILKLITVDVTVTNNAYMNFELQLHSSGLGHQPSAAPTGTIGAVSSTPAFTDIPKSNSQAYLGTGTLSTITTDGYILKTRTLENKSQLVVSNDVYETLLTRSQISHYDTLYLVVYSTSQQSPNVIACMDFIESN
jgi:hypothetical protein